MQDQMLCTLTLRRLASYQNSAEDAGMMTRVGPGRCTNERFCCSRKLKNNL